MSLKLAIILVLGLLNVLVVTALVKRNNSAIVLEPYICNATEANYSETGSSDCGNHIFPSRNQTLESLNNSTFMRLSDDAGYTIRYFNSDKNEKIDGHFSEMKLSMSNKLESRVTTDHGPWWLRDVLIPIKFGNQIANMTAQALCTHDKDWEPRDDEADDADDVYTYCDIVWDLSGKFLYGKSYLDSTHWKKIASNDTYDLIDIIKNYSPDFPIQVQEKASGNGVGLSPEELSGLIRVKNKEIEDKMQHQ